MEVNRQNPREAIKKLFVAGDLEALLDKAATVHGHYCSYLALGVKASHVAFKRLGIIESTGMEEIMAVVECNSCFIDGIQAVSGCTFGNNAMVYKDLGKTAVTFIDRKRNKAVRIAVKTFDEVREGDLDAEEAMKLFDRAVKKREELTPKENQRMQELWTAMSFRVLNKPDNEVFDIREISPEKLVFAPIFESIRCSVCNENVMETRIKMKGQKPVCISCGKDEYWMVAGRGIHPMV